MQRGKAFEAMVNISSGLSSWRLPPHAQLGTIVKELLLRYG